MNEEAGHLVQWVEDDRVLPGEDGQGDGSVAHHVVWLEPGTAEPSVRAHTAGQTLQQYRGVEEITEIQHEEMVLDSFVGQKPGKDFILETIFFYLYLTWESSASY